MYNELQRKVKKEGSKKSQAAIVEEVARTFIEYDIPTSRGLQYLNDMGLLMFTKFPLRIASVIMETIQDAPTKAIAFEIAQQVLGDIQDITDDNLIKKGYQLLSGNLLRWPTDNIDSAYNVSNALNAADDTYDILFGY